MYVTHRSFAAPAPAIQDFFWLCHTYSLLSGGFYNACGGNNNLRMFMKLPTTAAETSLWNRTSHWVKCFAIIPCSSRRTKQAKSIFACLARIVFTKWNIYCSGFALSSHLQICKFHHVVWRTKSTNCIKKSAVGAARSLFFIQPIY